ncbi:YncE family protein [Olivibacter sp. SDN3]|uniref:YncE family protein n=1 Tax=Olivibacter sp. SDN3 TaxID=2764720 RepID=UPI002106E280|nr:YncE family protein [Olivibacter sp. SDN3]
MLLFCGCRKNAEELPEESFNFKQGFYLLNEGNMSMNKASLDFYDYHTDRYERDVYRRANPGVVLGLGDVGNDVQLYGSKLYVIVNASNKIEVLDANTAKRIKQIDLINCRYITFHEDKAYVSSYNAEIGLDPNSPLGKVVEIDTSTLSITRSVSVGRQPDGVAIANNKLYVANSGGYNPNAYERTLSVIDLDAFAEIKRIDVGINLHRLKVDHDGNILVSSRGDYTGQHSNLFLVDTKTDKVAHTFNLPISNFWIDGKQLYTYSSEWSNQEQQNNISYHLIDLSDVNAPPSVYIKDGSEEQIAMPYGIAVDPERKDIYITDAKNYVTPGTLHQYDTSGKLVRSFSTGDIPAHIAFINF